jgi:hypothetical protein
VGNTLVNVDETNGSFDVGDDLNPTGAADLNGAMFTFEYQSFSGGVVSGRLLTDEAAPRPGGLGCRASGTIFNS